jgi:hypothetical protein
MFKRKVTQRGFEKFTFKDSYGIECRLQKSSSAMRDCIWLGIVDVDPKIMASQAKQFGIETEETCGWVEYPIPKEVMLNSEMHLTQKQVADMLPVLTYFARHGELPTWDSIPEIEDE